MTTRRIVLGVIALLLVFGIGNFIVRSIQIRGELSKIAAKDPQRQEEGVRNLMARDALFDALQGGAPKQTRLNAVAALQRIADRGNEMKAFEQLLQMLKDPDTESAEAKTHPVRDAAKDAVAAVGVKYSDRLINAAKDPDKAIQDQSRAALKKIGAPLQEAMAAKLDDPKLRAPFGDILSSIGPQTIPLITPFLTPARLAAFEKPEDLAKAKVELIEILGKFKVPAPSKDPDPVKVQEQAAKITAARPQVVQAVQAIVPFKDDTDPNVRRTVVTSLSNIALPEGEAVLIAALSDPQTDSDARAAAAGALGAIATPEANAAMVRALRDYDLRVATAAAAGLKRAGDRAAGAISAALADPNPAIRARAAEAAGGMTTPTLAARALGDADAEVRVAAAAALGDIGGPASVAPLMNALNDTGSGVAAAASQSLSRVGDAAIPMLVARLSAGDTVAYRVSQALEVIGRPAVDSLLAVARTGNGGARWAAITLGQIGDPRAVPALEALKSSPDPDTAWAADIALAKVKES